MSVTLRFQSSGSVPGDGRPVVMRGPSLTIGRGEENDLVLPDPDRQISKTHCVIENHNGNLVAVDLSTNGTFLNYGKIALGRTPTPLNDGDVLIMGAYELIVNVSAARQDDLAPLAEERISGGRADRAPDPMQLLDDAGPGGDFLDGLLGGNRPKGPGQFRKQQDDFELLPPLGEDGPLLGPAPVQEMGPAMRDHGPSGSDAFRPPPAIRSAIPDDWDDLLAPVKPAFVAPVAAPAQPARPQMIPDDDLLAPANVAPLAPVAPPAPPIAETPPPNAKAFEPFVTAAVPFDPFATDPNRPSKATAAADSAKLGAMPPPTPVTSLIAVPTPSSAAPPPQAAPSDAARAFLAGLGADEVRITDAELPDAMARLGRTLKSMITGLREILMTRTSIKSEFRIEQTMINVGGNNPLKFSISPEQAIEAMVKPTARGYLPSELAAAQALEDIKAHEVAMVTGMEAALKGVLARLNPETLTTKIEAKGGFGFLKSRKAQYWEIYEAMYAEIADQAENDFHELFAREFAAAYKKQLAMLKQSQT